MSRKLSNSQQRQLVSQLGPSKASDVQRAVEQGRTPRLPPATRRKVSRIIKR